MSEKWCMCEISSISPISDRCGICHKPANPEWFVWRGPTRYYEPPVMPPPALGVRVADGIDSEDKPG